MSAPIAKKKIFPVEVAIWQGEYGCSITIGKTYKDKSTQQWKTTGSLSIADACVALVLLGEAIKEAQALDARQRQAQGNPPARAQRGAPPQEDDAPFEDIGNEDAKRGGAPADTWEPF